MEKLSELLDRIEQSEGDRIFRDGSQMTVYYRWMLEATNRIQEQNERLNAIAKRVNLIDDDFEITPEMDRLMGPKKVEVYVFAAFRSYPDMTAPAPVLHSIHTSLPKAISALYPDRIDFQTMFRPVGIDRWEGPDGFGMVRKLKVDDSPDA